MHIKHQNHLQLSNGLAVGRLIWSERYFSRLRVAVVCPAPYPHEVRVGKVPGEGYSVCHSELTVPKGPLEAVLAPRNINHNYYLCSTASWSVLPGLAPAGQALPKPTAEPQAIAICNQNRLGDALISSMGTRLVAAETGAT